MPTGVRRRDGRSRRPAGTRGHPDPRDDYDTSNLRPKTYTGPDLVLLLGEYTDIPLSSKLSPQEIDRLRQPAPQLTNKHDLKRYLENYLPLLDKAYFCHSIRNNLNSLQVLDSRAARRKALGVDYVGMYNPLVKTIYINFDQVNSVYEPERNAGACLAHEMLHAFIWMYSCRCLRCLGKRFSNEVEGISGHGAVFCNALIKIQEAMSRDLGWDVDCGLEVSVQTQMHYFGWRPGSEQLARWGLSHLEMGGSDEGKFEDDDEYEYDNEKIEYICCSIM